MDRVLRRNRRLHILAIEELFAHDDARRQRCGGGLHFGLVSVDQQPVPSSVD